MSAHWRTIHAIPMLLSSPTWALPLPVIDWFVDGRACVGVVSAQQEVFYHSLNEWRKMNEQIHLNSDSIKHLVSSSPAYSLYLLHCFSFISFWRETRTSCNWSESPNHLKNVFTLETNQTRVQKIQIQTTSFWGSQDQTRYLWKGS